MSYTSDLEHWRIEAKATYDYVEEIHILSDSAKGIRAQRTTRTWEVLKTLGRGGFGEVRLESHGHKQRAMKRIWTSSETRLNDTDYERELKALLEFSKPKYKRAACFVEFYGWFPYGGDVFLAMEYVPLGDLDKVLGETRVVEAEAREIGFQILTGLNIMHLESFAHRDLKPGNVLVVHGGPNWWVKLADFGLSKKLTGSTVLDTRGGTVSYMAPEVRQLWIMSSSPSDTKYTNLVDLWALGCIIYRLATGTVPFSKEGVLEAYCKGDITFPEQALDNFSALGTEFTQRLLQPNPNCRISSTEALEHPWITTNSDRRFVHIQKNENSIAAPEMTPPEDLSSSPRSRHDRKISNLARKLSLLAGSPELDSSVTVVPHRNITTSQQQHSSSQSRSRSSEFSEPNYNSVSHAGLKSFNDQSSHVSKETLQAAQEDTPFLQKQPIEEKNTETVKLHEKDAQLPISPKQRAGMDFRRKQNHSRRLDSKVQEKEEERADILQDVLAGKYDCQRHPRDSLEFLRAKNSPSVHESYPSHRRHYSATSAGSSDEEYDELPIQKYKGPKRERKKNREIEEQAKREIEEKRQELLARERKLDKLEADLLLQQNSQSREKPVKRDGKETRSRPRIPHEPLPNGRGSVDSLNIRSQEPWDSRQKFVEQENDKNKSRPRADQVHYHSQSLRKRNGKGEATPDRWSQESLHSWRREDSEQRDMNELKPRPRTPREDNIRTRRQRSIKREIRPDRWSQEALGSWRREDSEERDMDEPKPRPRLPQEDNIQTRRQRSIKREISPRRWSLEVMDDDEQRVVGSSDFNTSAIDAIDALHQYKKEPSGSSQPRFSFSPLRSSFWSSPDKLYGPEPVLVIPKSSFVNRLSKSFGRG